MDRFINMRLISNPFNWATVTLMVVVGAYAVHLLFNVAPNSSEN